MGSQAARIGSLASSSVSVALLGEGLDPWTSSPFGASFNGMWNLPFVTQGQAIHAADHLLRGSHCLGNAIATFFTHPCISTEKQGVSTHFEHPESETGKLKEKKKKMQLLKTKKASGGASFALCKFWKSQKIPRYCRKMSPLAMKFLPGRIWITDNQALTFTNARILGEVWIGGIFHKVSLIYVFSLFHRNKPNGHNACFCSSSISLPKHLTLLLTVRPYNYLFRDFWIGYRFFKLHSISRFLWIEPRWRCGCVTAWVQSARVCDVHILEHLLPRRHVGRPQWLAQEQPPNVDWKSGA